MGIQTTASQLLASKLLRHFNMKPLIILGLVAFARAQYSGETQDLSNSQLDALKDIFGDAAAGGAYSGQQVGRLEGGTNGVEAREMVEAPWSARASLTQLLTSRLVSLPGVSVVARTTHLVSMPLCPRVSAGLTTP